VTYLGHRPRFGYANRSQFHGKEDLLAQVMVLIMIFVIAALCGYFVGGWNPAIAISRIVYKQDIRECGSGNPGFTNFKRTFGNKWAWIVLALDLAKAAVAVAVFAPLIVRHGEVPYALGAAFTGAFCMLGHAYPLIYKFKGGKGFLVYMSTIWFVDWRAGLTATVLLVVLLLTTKYMSLSTMSAVVASALCLCVVSYKTPWVIFLCGAQALFMIIRHKENIKRLVSGTENKFYLKSKK